MGKKYNENHERRCVVPFTVPLFRGYGDWGVHARERLGVTSNPYLDDHFPDCLGEWFDGLGLFGNDAKLRFVNQ